MKKFLRSFASFLFRVPDILTPRFVKVRADAERYGIDTFIYSFAQKEVKSDDRVLDAGAGSFRYRHAFSHAKYESTDFEDVFDENMKGQHTFTCSLDDIPIEDNTYDVVVNTQVIEHVEYPQKVVSELARVLKPGGKLFLTTPQISQVHGAPYNFFFYTQYGLESLFKHAGLEVQFIRARGGVFWVLGRIFSLLPAYIFYQHAFTGFKKGVHFKPEFKNKPLSYILLPFYLISQIVIGFWIPFLFFYLDRLDFQRNFTLGYVCYCTKPVPATTHASPSRKPKRVRMPSK